jgi:hypothetical protein
MVTFPVDDVVPAIDTLPTQPLRDLFPDALVVGGDPRRPVLVQSGVHPLLSAVGHAFADHRPLILTPDAVWLTIAAGVAQHIRLRAEELRPRLVNHAGRKRLTVEVDMPQDAGSWADVVDQFGTQLGTEIDDAGLFECDFSTSTDVERVAGRIVLLDAYSPYFALWMMTICGIPTVTLTGTVEDWRRIRSRVDTIAGFGLQTWCASLAPIADQFVRAAAGDVDTAFWQRIYNPIDAYGEDVITGWATRMYPYLSGYGVLDTPNPMLDLPIDEPRNMTTPDRRFYDGPGIRSTDVPATLSRVIVNINDRGARVNRMVALYAGLVGVAQDDNGALRPIAGWHLEPAIADIDDVLDRIIRDHETTPPQPVDHEAADADLVAVYRRIGSATLFDGAWQLRPVTEHRLVLRGRGPQGIVTIIDLADGRSIAAATDYERQTIHWVICRFEETEDAARLHPRSTLRFRLVDEPGNVPVYGT